MRAVCPGSNRNFDAGVVTPVERIQVAFVRKTGQSCRNRDPGSNFKRRTSKHSRPLKSLEVTEFGAGRVLRTSEAR